MDNELELFRSKNKNKDFTLISRDCVGGVLYHQLGLKFLSPTINLFLTPTDFNYFCLYLEDYLDGCLEEYKGDEVDYPVGLLYPKKGSKCDRPVKIGFMHYETFDIAANKWNERKERINRYNIYVLNTMCYPLEIAELSSELIKQWNQIKFKKVILVDKKYGFDDEFVINKPEGCEEYAWLLYAREDSWKRTFNEFDFIKFLNK